MYTCDFCSLSLFGFDSDSYWKVFVPSISDAEIERENVMKVSLSGKRHRKETR